MALPDVEAVVGALGPLVDLLPGSGAHVVDVEGLRTGLEDEAERVAQPGGEDLAAAARARRDSGRVPQRRTLASPAQGLLAGKVPSLLRRRILPKSMSVRRALGLADWHGVISGYLQPPSPTLT